MSTLEQDAQKNARTDGAAGRRPRLYPNWRIVTFVLATIVGAVIVQNSSIDDLALMNIISGVMLGVGFLVLLGWFTFGSDYPLAARVFPLVALVAGGSIGASRYKLVGVDGSMMPKFAPRYGERHDEQLEGDFGFLAAADVSQTTEFDFPKFLGPDANSAVANIALDPDWKSNPPKQEWSREVGAAWSGFSVVNGFAFTMEQRGESELVTCYRVDDGQPCWSHAIKTTHNTVMGYLGPRSTPTVDKGRVYAMGATGILRCLNGEDGKEIWVRDLFKEHGFDQEQAEKAVAWGRSGSAVVQNDVVYIPVGGASDGKKISVLAMDAATGETKWEAGDDQTSYATPAILTVAGVEQLVMVNESSVSGYSLTNGEELWSHPWAGASNMNATVSQPHVVDEDFVFLSKGYGIGAALIELSSNGSGDWSVDPVWESRVLKTKFSNVAIKDGVAYGLDDGILCAVDVETGDKLWKKGRYKYGQILLVGDHLLVMSEDGDLCLVAASGDKYQELARVNVLEGQTWNTFAIYEDRVLVRNSEQAACYRLKLLGE